MIRAIYSLAIIIVTLLATDSFAQRIPDNSLSPAETALQPNISNNSAYQQYLKQNNISDPRYPSDAPMPPDINTPPASGSFMDNYCDPNFKPLIANDPHYANLADCIQQQKAEPCSQYQQLPADAKRVLDEAISCASDMQDDENPNGQQAANNTANCDDSDISRLQLIKKYWRDQNTVYALVFLPDEVTNASTQCLRGRR